MQEQFDQLEDLLGFDLLASLLDISQKDLAQYDAGKNRVPEIVQQRVLFLIKIINILVCAYNDIGIRQWFVRKRPQLEKKSPAEILKDAWDPKKSGPRRVLLLAEEINI